MSEGKKTVLLVDDEVMTNVMHTMMLQKHPQVGAIHSVRNGKEALTFLEDALENNVPFPDVIFLDINMPVMNGFDLISKLKTHPTIDYSSMQIVILTSSVHPKDMAQARQLGIAHYFAKPLTEYHIQQSIEKTN